MRTDAEMREVLAMGDYADQRLIPAMLYSADLWNSHDYSWVDKSVIHVGKDVLVALFTIKDYMFNFLREGYDWDEAFRLARVTAKL